MKIGLDVHGVIDAYPVFFRDFSWRMLRDGHEVHIVTGQEWEKAYKTISDLDIVFTNHFSIVDWGLENLELTDAPTTPTISVDGSDSLWRKIWKTDKGYWMHYDKWNECKGIYAHNAKLDIHFDDSEIYCKYFPTTCSYIKVGENFEKILTKLF